MIKVAWSDYAEADRHRIYTHIDSSSPQNAILVDNRTWTAIAGLAHFPEIGRLCRIEGTRELVIHRTPYIAAYLLEPEAVLILRILHGAQEWPARVPLR